MLTTPSLLSASHFKRYRGSEKSMAAFRSIDDLPAMLLYGTLSLFILDPDLECHLLTFNRLLVVFCHILSATGE